MKNTRLKVAIVESGLTHQELAQRLNRDLDWADSVSEQRITRFVTNRATPSPAQRTAIARILKQPATRLFPD
jgi:transcriptional regulator with XRE-family HTH domain